MTFENTLISNPMQHLLPDTRKNLAISTYHRPGSSSSTRSYRNCPSVHASRRIGPGTARHQENGS
jgi:hypothetical protein